MNKSAASVTREDEKSDLTVEQVIDGPASYLKLPKEIRQKILSNVFSVTLHHDNLGPCPYDNTDHSFEPWNETENWKEKEETEHTRMMRQQLTNEQEGFGGDDQAYFRMRRLEKMTQRMKAGLDDETLENRVAKIRLLKRIQKMMAEKTVALEVKRFETLADRMNEVLCLEKGKLAEELREEVALVLEMRKKRVEKMVEECLRGDGWLILGEEWYEWAEISGQVSRGDSKPSFKDGRWYTEDSWDLEKPVVGATEIYTKFESRHNQGLKLAGEF